MYLHSESGKVGQHGLRHILFVIGPLVIGDFLAFERGFRAPTARRAWFRFWTVRSRARSQGCTADRWRDKNSAGIVRRNAFVHFGWLNWSGGH